MAFERIKKLWGVEKPEAPPVPPPPEKKLAIIIDLEEPLDEFADDQNIPAGE